jgi:Ulp1 family protease
LKFLKIHTPTHWSLVTVEMDLGRTKIVASDSCLGDNKHDRGFGADAEHAATLVQMWIKKQWDIFYAGTRCPDYTIYVDKTAPQQTNGVDCGIFMLANLMARLEDHERCGEIDPPRVRAWILVELYIEGLRSNSCDEHGAPLVEDERMERSVFGTPLEEEESMTY